MDASAGSSARYPVTANFSMTDGGALPSRKSFFSYLPTSSRPFFGAGKGAAALGVVPLAAVNKSDGFFCTHRRGVQRVPSR